MHVSRFVLLLRLRSSIPVGRWSGGRRWKSRWCEGGTLVVATVASKRTPKGNPRKPPPPIMKTPGEAPPTLLWSASCGGSSCLVVEPPLLLSQLTFTPRPDAPALLLTHESFQTNWQTIYCLQLQTSARLTSVAHSDNGDLVLMMRSKYETKNYEHIFYLLPNISQSI